jgi:hypothetical protein
MSFENHGCFFGEYENEFHSFFFITTDKYLALMNFYNIEVPYAESLNTLGDSVYVVRIKNQYVPIPREIFGEMYRNGYDIKTLDKKELIDKYSTKYTELTESYIDNIVNIVNDEIVKTANDLLQIKIMEQYKKNPVEDSDDDSDWTLDNDN